MRSKGNNQSAERVRSSGGSTRVRISSEPSYLSRLGVVWAYPLRLTIVTELYMREMSVTEFFHEFGGGSVGNMRWHFQKLAEHGWLRKVRSKKEGRGRPQDVYRSTELAFYDDECAEELPTSVRAAFSTRILQQMGERVACAREASTIDSGGGGHLSLASITLDERGWLESIQVLNGCLRALAQEQLDAKVRIAASGDSATVTMIALAGVESPSGRLGDRIRPGKSEAPVMKMDLEMPLETRLAKVFGDPVNIRIVRELNDVAMSPSELGQKMDCLPVWQLDRKCKHLEKYGWIARVEVRTGGMRRGATEVFYRATRPPADVDLWPETAWAAGVSQSTRMLNAFYGRIIDSIKAGVLDARHNRHLTWTALLLDELGRRQVMDLLKTEEKRLGEIQHQAGLRLKVGDEPGFLTTVFLAGFEIPPFVSVSS
jgi:DNA-binding HxlR family transcriptional regulator